MKILVINCGSSSLKYQLFDMESENWLAKGICEAIGTSTSAAKGSTPDGKEFKMTVDIPDHKVAFNIVKDALTSGECKVIDDLKEIDAVGHRVVQGGDRYTESILIDDSVVKGIDEDKITAKYENGLLTINLPLKEKLETSKRVYID